MTEKPKDKKKKPKLKVIKPEAFSGNDIEAQAVLSLRDAISSIDNPVGYSIIVFGKDKDSFSSAFDISDTNISLIELPERVKTILQIDMYRIFGGVNDE